MNKIAATAEDNETSETIACAMRLRVYLKPAQITIAGRWLHVAHRFRNQAVEFTQNRRRERGRWFAQHPVLANTWKPEEFKIHDVSACSHWLTDRLEQARERVRFEMGLICGKRQIVEAVSKCLKHLTREEIDEIEDTWLLTLPRTVLDQVLQDLRKTINKADKDRKEARKKPLKSNGIRKDSQGKTGKPKGPRLAGFPVFHKWSYPGSIRVQVVAEKNASYRDHWQVGEIFMPGVGKLTFRDGGYDLPNTPPQMMTLSRDAAGNWHVSFFCAPGEGKADANLEDNLKHTLPTDTTTGLPLCEALDFGLSSRTIDTSGKKTDGRTRHLKRFQNRAAGLQRGLSRKSYGSKRWLKRKNTLGRVHVRITNVRDAELLAIAKDVMDQVAILCLEDLFLGAMLQNRNLAPSAHDASLGQLKQYLYREAQKQGKLILECGRFDATSQLCSHCGFKNTALKDLKIRNWVCPGCNTHHDRDMNAAINIRAMSLKRALATASENDVGILDRLGVKHRLHPALKEFIVRGGLTALSEQFRSDESRLLPKGGQGLHGSDETCTMPHSTLLRVNGTQGSG